MSSMQIAARTLIACFLMIGAAKLFDNFLAARAQDADREWKRCVKSAAERGLKRETSLANESLLVSVMSECKPQHETAANQCAPKNDCEIILRAAAVDRIDRTRKELAFAREETRKRDLIEISIQKLEGMNVSREDIKEFFRDEILTEEADEKNAEAEAKAESGDQERPGRFGW